jgi:hypothetical protein
MPVFSAVSSVKVRISSLGGFLLPRELPAQGFQAHRNSLRQTCQKLLGCRSPRRHRRLRGVAASSQDTQRQMQGQPTAAQQADGAKPGMMWRTQRWRGASARGSDPVSGDEPQTESDLNF